MTKTVAYSALKGWNGSTTAGGGAVTGWNGSAAPTANGSAPPAANGSTRSVAPREVVVVESPNASAQGSAFGDPVTMS